VNDDLDNRRNTQDNRALDDFANPEMFVEEPEGEH
jgi:hypothetical protein